MKKPPLWKCIIGLWAVVVVMLVVIIARNLPP